MNTLSPTPRRRTDAECDALEGRIGLRLAALMEESSTHLDHAVSERLRFGREQALERARAGRLKLSSATPVLARGSTAVLGAPEMGWGWRLLWTALPALALALGLVAVDQWQSDEQIFAMAEVDAGLLSDSVPPEAYRDPGFAEFVKESLSGSSHLNASTSE